MMGRSSQDQEQLFYSFNLEEVVPAAELRHEVERWPGRDPERSPEIPWETAGFRWERH